MRVLKKIVAILFVFLAVQTALPAQQTQTVKLQLKWKHQFQFAGYYAAIEHGFYREAGIEVKLLEAIEGQNPSDAVFDGRAAFGVCTSDILLMRSEGKSAVVLATIFQHSPQILIASKASGINHVHDLVGKRIAMEPNAADIIAYMHDEGITLDQCIIDQHSFDVNGLLNGTMDAISAYSTDEPFLLDKAKFDCTIISPVMGGIDFYGDVLFTTATFINDNPVLVKKFRDATIQGWVYAMENHEEIIHLIFNKYSTRHTIDHLRFEADKMQTLIMPEVIEMGYNNPGRWKSIAQTYKQLNMLDASFSLDGLLYLQTADEQVDLPWKLILGLVFIGLLISSIAIFYYKASRRFEAEIKNRRSIEKDLQESEEKHRVLFMNSPDAYLIIVDGLFVDFNHAALSMLGATREQVVNKPPDYLSPEFQPDGKSSMVAAQERIDYALEHGSHTFEWLHCRIDRTEFIAEVSIAPIKLAGKPALFTTWRDITERKRAEEALKYSEEKLKSIINSANIGVAITDNHARYVIFNQCWIDMIGYAEHEILNKTILDFTHPDDIQKSKIWFDKLMKGDIDTYRFEKRFVRKDGSVFWSDSSVSAIKDINNNIINVSGMLVDITASKQLEVELRASEEKFRLLLNSAAEAIYGIDAQGYGTFCNSAALKILGYASESEVLGRNMHELIHHKHPDGSLYPVKDCKIFKAFKKGIEAHVDDEVLWRKDGSSFPVEYWTYPIFRDGEIIGSVVTFFDISDRRLAEKTLRESEEKYRTLVETMSDGVYRSTHEGRFIDVNPAMVRILGYNSKEELMAIDIKTQLYFAEEERESADLEEKLEEMAVFRLRKKDGSEIWVEDHGRHVLDQNGEILYHEGSLREVTDRKIAEDEIKLKNQKLQKLNAEKDKFLSIIAHDLKSPFNGIMGFSQLLVEQLKEKDYSGIEKYAEIILQSSERAVELLTNLMEWARSQTGRMEFNPEYFEMVKLINQITPLFDDIAGQKSISIKRDLPRNASVFADRPMISTILRNLISNAIKFSYPGGEIVISVEESQTGLTVSVSDTGVGIPKTSIDKLFRIDENYSTKGTLNEKGTGLGLILCKDFIEKHSGKIWVESEVANPATARAGRSTFYFTIPVSYSL